MTNGEPKERRETRETDRSHRLTITSKPFNHQQWSQDGGDRRWPLEVIERRVIRIPGVPRFHVSPSGLMSFAPQGGVSEASASRSSHPFLPPGGMERVRGSVSVR